MNISTDHITLLLAFQEMDTHLGDEREKETEQVFTLLDVLKEEATVRSLDVYTSLVQQHHPNMYPWSAIRPMDISEFPDSASPGERDFERAPPALFLILNRRPELEPTKVGDKVPSELFTSIWEALKNWSPNELKSRIGPDGWQQKKFGIIQIPPTPKPKQPGQLFTPPVIPRPPIPEPPSEPAPPSDPPLDTDPPLDDPAPPLDPVEPDPPSTEPDEVEADEAPDIDEPAPDIDEPLEDNPPGGEPDQETSPWKEIGVTAALAVGCGAFAYWIGSRSST